MRIRSEVSPEKLRGGFYTPDPLVDLCLERVASLTRGCTALRLLEPSAGDGAFIRGVARSSLRDRVSDLAGIEILESEATKASEALTSAGISGSVHIGSAVEWSATSCQEFDATIGNPPFVRFQFISDRDRQSADLLADRLGLSFGGVSNLWLPVLLGALGRLRLGGVFAFVIPAECFTGVSAGVLREWLVGNTKDLRFDLFAPGSYPDVLQEVVVLSGRRTEPQAGPVKCSIREHPRVGRPRSTTHTIPLGIKSWTQYLLTKTQLAAFEEAAGLEVVASLGSLARFEVAAVTGANEYFTVDSSTLAAYDLATWSRPLLPRTRYAPGLRYTADDHRVADVAGAKVHLLDFSGERSDPEHAGRPAAYIAEGEDADLHLRYKCRIREPWYRVPFIRPGEMMLSKRSHLYPKVVLNDAGVVTTDTIYRGTPKDQLAGRSGDLVAGFHNSLTLLSAELVGRSFGGGVLELVPSEVSRLQVPFIPGFNAELDRLDAVARSVGEGLELIDETDLLLNKADMGLTQDLLETLREARVALAQRRFDRN